MIYLHHLRTYLRVVYVTVALVFSQASTKADQHAGPKGLGWLSLALHPLVRSDMESRKLGLTEYQLADIRRSINNLERDIMSRMEQHVADAKSMIMFEVAPPDYYSGAAVGQRVLGPALKDVDRFACEYQVKALHEILSDKQYERFEQIERQLKGPWLLLDRDMQLRLRLSAAQQEDIQDIEEESEAEYTRVFEEIGNRYDPFSGKQQVDIQQRKREITSAAAGKLWNVLQPGQKQQLQQLLGPSIKLASPGKEKPAGDG